MLDVYYQGATLRFDTHREDSPFPKLERPGDLFRQSLSPLLEHEHPALLYQKSARMTPLLCRRFCMRGKHIV
jgi:hypothetical protein